MKVYLKFAGGLTVLFMILMLMSCMGASLPENHEKNPNVTSMKPGVYKQTVSGMHEGLVVDVTLGSKRIDKVEVVENNDTPGISDAAIESMPGIIVEKQSLSVDAVSGATMTSNGILAAVKAAIVAAGGNPLDFTASVSSEEEKTAARTMDTTPPSAWDESCDVVVVGGGFAGLAAAYSAKINGADVILVEKMPFVGGNSQINGGVYAAYTSKIAGELQKKLNLVPDTPQKHIEDTMKGGDNFGDIELVKNMVYGSPFYLDLLLDNGLKVRQSLTRPGGHYGYRTYTTINGQGSDIVQVQKKMADEVGVKIATNTKMVTVYREQQHGGRVVGIGVETKEGTRSIQAKKGVILCAGGFAANVGMRSKHVPFLTKDLPTTNHVGATGEVITQAQLIGANTLQMSYIQLYPFANPNNGVLDAYAVIPFSGPSSGVVYVNVEGKRYVNEGERRDVCAHAAQNSGGFPTFCIMGEDIVKKGGFISDSQLRDGMKADRIFVADSLEQLAKIINGHTYAGHKVAMDPAELVKTISTHNTPVTKLSLSAPAVNSVIWHE